MSGAVVVAICVAIGNFLQGWDNATISGAIVYIKKEFKLEDEPTIEGLIVSMSLIGSVLITMCTGAVADWLGRRPLLILSSVFYFVSALVMLWSPNVYVLLLARLLDGFGIGLAITLVPIYISETAPPDIRGLLNTLPQFTCTAGMFFSFCMVFGVSLTSSASWRLMLSVLLIPALIYFALNVFYLPESPRWLVSKGRMVEAKKVLQRLCGKEDVSGEMALLVEGLGIGGETAIEEYILGPPHDLGHNQQKEQIMLYGPEEGVSLVARPVEGQSFVSRQGSIVNTTVPLMDPVVSLFGSVHEKIPDTGSKGSMLFPHLGSLFNVVGNQTKNEDWDEESLIREGEDYPSEADEAESDSNLHSPLISRQTTTTEKDMVPQPSQGSIFSIRQSSLTQGANKEVVGGAVIGGGWKLAWKWTEKEGPEGNKETCFKRIYLHETGVAGAQRGSQVSLAGNDVPSGGEYIHAAALVSQPALYSKEIEDQHPIGPAMVHPAKVTEKGPFWINLFEPGVKHALIVGMGLQILQQFTGISGVMFYTPQILERAGVQVLLSNMGISSDSASFLISAIVYLLMLPCIAVAMRLMDLSGRRSLLLGTIPILIVTLVVLVIGSAVSMGSIAKAAISTVCIIVCFCSFVMGFGPVPNILCSEIFPTRVRGICIAMCALTYWIGNIIVTYSLPALLSSIGLSGVFGIFAVVCIISWVFVFLKVPETKGMPLEVITEFFGLGAKQAAAAA